MVLSISMPYSGTIFSKSLLLELDVFSTLLELASVATLELEFVSFPVASLELDTGFSAGSL
jgi:hypothetical protein